MIVGTALVGGGPGRGTRQRFRLSFRVCEALVRPLGKLRLGFGGLVLVAAGSVGACSREPADPVKLASSPGSVGQKLVARNASSRRRTEALDLEAAARRLEPLHQRKRAPGPNDWLASHREPGQSFEEYR